MAKQKSPLIKLQGTIGDISFYQTQDGYLARQKGGIHPDRIKNDPAFRLTRLNAAEFGTAGKAGKLFRSAWTDELRIASDNRLVGRVAQALMKVVQTDTTHSFGQRTVANGNLSLLEGFQFNRDIALGAVLKVPYTIAVDRASGKVTIDLAPFVPQTGITVPTGSTHFRIIAAAAAIDFVNVVTTTGRQASANLPWDNSETPAVNLQLEVTTNSTHPLFVILGIEFMKIVNNEVFSQSKGLNALQLVKVAAS